MKHKIVLIISLVIYSHAFGIIPESEPSETPQFWNLSTGSRIAYYFFKGHEPRNPFPVIYLHGGPGGFATAQDIAVFSKLADDGYDVYLYDQIGGGKSDRLNNIREYSIKRHLKDLEAIIDLTGASRVIFIGHSWGASLAPLYQAMHPEKVEKLVFSGPGGMIPKKFYPFIPLPDSVKLKNRETTRHFASEYLEPEALKRYNQITNFAGFGIKLTSDKEIDSLLDCLITNKSKLRAKVTNLADTLIIERGSGGYAHIVTGMKIDKGKDKRDILKSLNTPVLLLLGESDPIQWGCVADYLNVYKNIKLIVIPESGHSVFSYQPELCLKLTREFLSSSF